MGANSRLTIAAHALAWMGLNERMGGEVATSEQIANSVNTNPVVIRRLLGELREAGLVESRRGAGAGWRLRRAPESISLAEVYRAVEGGPLFALHAAAPNQRCPVGHGIRAALTPVYEDAEAALRAQLGRTSVADVLGESLSAP
ncbi:Rrf2 family transcriptional regulator [Actinospica sp. MGRD01-02]|uniref:Rrf2 family transcriptional regulator n=1 Tax=Actinospica acidithermotolerans TaxID=2828514 RepID=A0A941E3V5_9ACTN|nr:Rrf2 family transcriptional regulator [Actinospica acidithermotolerans]MBR7825710.1 Rrf2 family transcriptional regulator [Actinospica acidithermotolerans]